MTTTRGCLLITVVLGLAAWARAAQEESPRPAAARKPEVKRSETPRELLDFKRRLAEISRDMRVPGVAVAVVAADRLVYLEAAGSRDAARTRPVTPDTRFYIDTCTQPIVAAAVMILAEDGKIEIDAPVRKYLPRFELGRADTTSRITVVDLLSHAEGIDSRPIHWLESYTGEIDDDRFYRWLRKTVPEHGHRFTHLHYSLAGRIIEAVAGKSWKDVVTERIFEPAGMSSATCRADALYAGGDAALPAIRTDTGYAQAAVRKTDRTMNAAGGVALSIRDFVKWLRLNMKGGEIDGRQVLPKGAVAGMQRLHAEGGRQWPAFIRRTSDGHGLGWEIGTYVHRTLISSHGNSFVGAAAHISFMPEENIGVVVLANADGACADVVAFEVYNRLLVPDPENLMPMYQESLDRRVDSTREFDLLFASNPADEGGLSLPPEAYVGAYVNDDWGTVKVRIQDDHLVGALGDLPLRLGLEGVDRFAVGYGLRRPDSARFEVGEGRVRAILIDHSAAGAAVRYSRR